MIIKNYCSITDSDFPPCDRKMAREWAKIFSFIKSINLDVSSDYQELVKIIQNKSDTKCNFFHIRLSNYNFINLESPINWMEVENSTQNKYNEFEVSAPL